MKVRPPSREFHTEVFILKFRKTSQNQRQTYTFNFANGDKVVFEPGKATTIRASGARLVQIDESITELTIKQLHSEDDAEVYSNLKQVNCEDDADRKKRIAKKKKWAEEHPNEDEKDNPYYRPRKNLSLDYMPEDDDFSNDKSKILYEAAMLKESMEVDPYEKQREIVQDYVATLPKSMQQLYELLYIKEMKQSEICVELGLSKSTVSERVKTLENKIMKYFKGNPNFKAKNVD